MSKSKTPTVLTIAGHDTYGGAGIQVDSKTIHALGGYALSVATAITAQNSQGVKMVHALPKEVFKAQLFTLLDDMHICALKIGMLANRDIVEVLVEAIDKYKLSNIVLDTVLVSSSGTALLEPEAIELVKEALLPKVDLATPNIDEVYQLFGKDFSFTKEGRYEAFTYFASLGSRAVLFKGGHSKENEAVDYLHTKDEMVSFSSPRVQTTHTHGTGCVYASAIATYLAQGYDLQTSVSEAKRFLYAKLAQASSLVFNYKEAYSNRKEPFL